MKKILFALALCMPTALMAQTEVTTQENRVATLQAEAAAKAKAAQEAAIAAQEAARAAQEAAEAAAKEAQRLAAEAKKTAEEEVKNQKAAEAEVQKTAEAEAKKTAEASSWTAAPVTEPAPEVSANETKRAEKEASEMERAPYLAADAVPEVDGRVVWTETIDIPGADAAQLYTKALRFLTAMTKESNQLERSKVALVNESEHKIAATFQEWLVFSSSALSIDRTKLNYLLQVDCSDGRATATISHVHYSYPSQAKEDTRYQAEKWITDRYSVNKKRTRLLPVSGKFRRKTIDRKNEIFKALEAALK